MSRHNKQVLKRTGETESFDEQKLRKSLQRAHAPEEVTEKIVTDIAKEVDEAITSEEIYQQAFDKLKEYRKSYAAQYSMRQSLADLGPTGYPFEAFVARIFSSKGFTTKVGIEIDGSCCKHEVDVVAQNDDRLAIVEAKFHNKRSIKSSVQTPLYVRARFDDLAANDYGRFNQKDRSIEHWLVTNTKFSDQAKQYGECAGLKMVGWDHPEKNSLQKLITDSNLQPVTALTTLSGSHKRELTKQNIVLCKNLREQKSKLRELGFTDEQIQDVLDEVNHLCHVNRSDDNAQ